MKLIGTFYGLALVLLCHASFGLTENVDLSFNLAESKPLPQFEDSVCSCPLDDKQLTKCNAKGATVLESNQNLKSTEEVKSIFSDPFTFFKSLFNKIKTEEENENKDSLLLSLIQEKNKKPFACRLEREIKCEDGLRLKIVNASLSNLDKDTCSSFYENARITSLASTCNNTKETFEAISKRCNGKTSCSLSTDMEELESICECQNYKNLRVTYSCVIRKNKRQSDSYLKGRQRAFSRLLMIGLYPTYFNYGGFDGPQAVPETDPIPVPSGNLAGSFSLDPVALVEPSSVLTYSSSYDPYSSSLGSIGSYSGSYDDYYP